MLKYQYSKLKIVLKINFKELFIFKVIYLAQK